MTIEDSLSRLFGPSGGDGADGGAVSGIHRWPMSLLAKINSAEGGSIQLWPSRWGLDHGPAISGVSQLDGGETWHELPDEEER